MYSASLGQFLSRDPLPVNSQPDLLYDNNSFGDWLTMVRNLYGYVGSNPTNGVDPLGLRCCGPDVTRWFAGEVALWRQAAQSIQKKYRNSLAGPRTDPWTSYGMNERAYFDKLFAFQELAPKADYKDERKWDFSSPGCQDPCPGTVTLAGQCVGTNQLGNVIYGIIAQMTTLVFEARSFGRGSLNWAIGQPDPPWTDPGQQYRETAFDIGVQYAATGTYTGLTSTNPAAPIDASTPGCNPCSTTWDGPHSDPQAPRNPRIDPAGNLRK